MIFYNASTNADQKFLAPPKGLWFKIIDSENVLQKVFTKNVAGRRKMKSCKSSEARFAKVSHRSELCLRAKHPFEFSKNQNS